jgi:transcriptional regulator with GAF, ATPase, and Fis domain
MAASEPEAILRLEVLEAFQVRRSELRPLARWMEDRVAMLVAVVTRAGEAEGLLVLPRGRRSEALSLEEARTIKRLADALAALCHARAALARSLDRERAATVTAEAAVAALGVATGELERRAGVHVLAAERLARPATVGIYSAAARLAFEAVEAALRAGCTLFVMAPAGTDAVPYVARAHLASPRRGEPLVVVDGTATRDQDPARWRDPRVSPIALADRGLLLVVDGAALPAEVQRILASAHGERKAPWASEGDRPLDFALAMTATSPLAALVESRRLEPELAARLEDAASCDLPRLRDRPEDLRAIVSDRLAREGLRARGTPVGIDDGAFVRLLDHPFEGEDAELAVLVQRLVAACDGDVVRARDVDALLPPAPESERTRVSG